MNVFTNNNRAALKPLAAALALSLPAAHASVTQRGQTAGGVFTATNAASGNAVIAFERVPNGSLVYNGTYTTGGLGTGKGLGSQGSVVLNENHKWLLAVNAGSNQVSLFHVLADRLLLADAAPSGGIMPISVTVNGNLVYVLNAGGGTSASNISGFTITPRGRLTPLPHSTRFLSAANPAPAQVGFTPDGGALVVTEKGTAAPAPVAGNKVDSWRVNNDGYATPVSSVPSPGTTPFGFAFDSNNHLFVSEAAGVPAGSSASAYGVGSNGALTTISGGVTNHLKAACWAVVTPDDKYLYTADAASDALSGYRIHGDGSITLLNTDGVTAFTGTGTHPIDMAVTGNGRYLYVIETFTNDIGAFRVGDDGSLTPTFGISGLPVGDDGLAAW